MAMTHQRNCHGVAERIAEHGGNASSTRGF